MDTMVINIDDPQNYALLETYQIRSLPTLLVIDENGTILAQHFGYTPADSLGRSIEDAYYAS